jgi:RNA polymerase sigma-70 factor (ECF subfamily)
VDARAYERELRQLLSRAAAYARSLLRDRHDAEDAVQQAALRGWERIDRYDPSRPFKGWWFAVLHNCCIDLQRSRRADRTTHIGDMELVDDRPTEVVDWTTLADALAGLSETHREILRLKYFGDLSYDEIAETLQIPRGTVMSRLFLARKALAATMSKEDI